MIADRQAVQDRTQGRLLLLAAIFLGINALALSLSPATRARSWEAPLRWDHWLGYGLWLLLFVLAHVHSRRWLSDRDPYLLPIAAILSGWGLLSVWRLFPEFGARQLIWLAAGVAIYLLGLRLPGDLRFLRRYKYLWLTGGLALTGLTFFFGTNPLGYGPRMWLGCCGLFLQPSEPLKLLLIVYLAAYLADRSWLPGINSRMRASGGKAASHPALAAPALLPLLAPTGIMTGLALLLLLAQRDLGTASIFIFLYTAIVYVASARARIVATGAAVLLGAGIAGYALFDVVRVRIDAWLNPWLDPSGRSYQIVQSLIAIANGGLVGRGPGLGNPSLVPVPHSDFIFASITEETGLLGALALILLYALLAGRGLRLALRARDATRRYLAAGLTAYLAGQSALIIGGNLRLLPLTGVTLPFVSYGGSSLVTAFVSLLLLTHISSQPDDRLLPSPTTPPYLHLGAFLLAGLGAAALFASWWTIFRGSDLLSRTDNPRQALADRDVPRGAILDRRDTTIVESQGMPGSLNRMVLYPALSPLLGYSDPVYGQAGLESSLDDYLRGVRGDSTVAIWWDHLLYGEHPPGLNIRLTLDLEVQRLADEQLAGHPGALVLMNAATGEILAMASHPVFDANRLAQQWDALVSDPRAPLLDRAAQGMYAPGAALIPLLLAGQDAQAALPGLPAELSYTQNGVLMQCASSPATSAWPDVAQVGCPAVAAVLGDSLGTARLVDLFDRLGFFQAPQVRLPASASPWPADFTSPAQSALGEGLRLSPLQMAVAASAVAAGGNMPAPALVAAVKTPQAGWVLLPPLGQGNAPFQPASAARALQVLASPPSIASSLPLAGTGLSPSQLWHTIAIAPNGRSGGVLRHVTWYVGGTLQDDQHPPLVLALVLEEENHTLAAQVAEAVLAKAWSP